MSAASFQQGNFVNGQTSNSSPHGHSSGNDDAWLCCCNLYQTCNLERLEITRQQASSIFKGHVFGLELYAQGFGFNLQIYSMVMLLAKDLGVDCRMSQRSKLISKSKSAKIWIIRLLSYSLVSVFIARQHPAADVRYWYSNSVRPSVCPSARPPVTRWYCMKTD